MKMSIRDCRRKRKRGKCGVRVKTISISNMWNESKNLFVEFQLRAYIVKQVLR